MSTQMPADLARAVVGELREVPARQVDAEQQQRRGQRAPRRPQRHQQDDGELTDACDQGDPALGAHRPCRIHAPPRPVAPRRRRGVRLLFFLAAAIPRCARGRLAASPAHARRSFARPGRREPSRPALRPRPGGSDHGSRIQEDVPRRSRFAHRVGGQCPRGGATRGRGRGALQPQQGDRADRPAHRERFLPLLRTAGRTAGERSQPGALPDRARRGRTGGNGAGAAEGDLGRRVDRRRHRARAGAPAVREHGPRSHRGGLRVPGVDARGRARRAHEDRRSGPSRRRSTGRPPRARATRPRAARASARRCSSRSVPTSSR